MPGVNYLFVQVPLENNAKIGKISNLPANISIISTSFEKRLKPPKLQVGPTASKPGPMLLKQARTAEMFVPVEKLSRLMSKKLKITMVT